MTTVDRIALPPPRWMASPSAGPTLHPAPALRPQPLRALPGDGSPADRAATARSGGEPREEAAARDRVPASDGRADRHGETTRERLPRGLQLPFLAQQIAQERLSSGLHREPWDVGPLAYRRAGAEPPLGAAPAQSLDLAV